MGPSSHRPDQGVLPPGVGLSVGLPVVPVGVALPGVGAGLPVAVEPPSGGFVVVAPPATRGGRRGDVLPRRRALMLSRAGGRGVGARVGRRRLMDRRVVVVAGVGGLSRHGSGVGGVWLPPERREESEQPHTHTHIQDCLRKLE